LKGYGAELLDAPEVRPISRRKYLVEPTSSSIASTPKTSPLERGIAAGRRTQKHERHAPEREHREHEGTRVDVVAEELLAGAGVPLGGADRSAAPRKPAAVSEESAGARFRAQRRGELRPGVAEHRLAVGHEGSLGVQLQQRLERRDEAVAVPARALLAVEVVLPDA